MRTTSHMIPCLYQHEMDDLSKSCVHTPSGQIARLSFHAFLGHIWDMIYVRYIEGLDEKFIDWTKHSHRIWTNEIYFST